MNRSHGVVSTAIISVGVVLGRQIRINNRSSTGSAAIKTVPLHAAGCAQAAARWLRDFSHSCQRSPCFDEITHRNQINGCKKEPLQSAIFVRFGKVGATIERRAQVEFSSSASSLRLQQQ